MGVRGKRRRRRTAGREVCECGFGVEGSCRLVGRNDDSSREPGDGGLQSSTYTTKTETSAGPGCRHCHLSRAHHTKPCKIFTIRGVSCFGRELQGSSKPPSSSRITKTRSQIGGSAMTCPPRKYGGRNNSSLVEHDLTRTKHYGMGDTDDRCGQEQILCILDRRISTLFHARDALDPCKQIIKPPVRFGRKRIAENWSGSCGSRLIGLRWAGMTRAAAFSAWHKCHVRSDISVSECIAGDVVR